MKNIWKLIINKKILLIILFVLFFIYIYYTPYQEGLHNKKYNLAFYTCFYGINNNPAFKIPETPSEKYDCYYFSNNKDLIEKLKGTQWIGIFHDKPLTDDFIESAMYSKEVKTIPEHFDILTKYDYTCYLDSKLNKVSEEFVEKYIERFFVSQNYALIIREHEFIKENVWNEFNESMKQERYLSEKDKYKKYIDTQINNGLSEKTKYHCQTGFLIRNMKHDKIKEIDTTWYSHVQECGIQCQISFFFVKQLFNDFVYPFNESPFL